MPELPEVEGLRAALHELCAGKFIDRLDLASFSALKTFDVPVGDLVGSQVRGVSRWGKFLGVDADGRWLIFHLARAGWVKVPTSFPATPPRPGKGPLVLRLVLDDGTGFELTEAGTRKGLAVYVVADPTDVPGIASLGIEATELRREDLDALLDAAGKSQLKGILRAQSNIAGIGNAYSDEILHAARLSPFAPASTLSLDQREALFAAFDAVLTPALARCVGHPPSALKDAKRSQLAVHGRTGQACFVCGDTIADVNFADSSLQYCPTCQTGGKKLADRRLSKLLK